MNTIWMLLVVIGVLVVVVLLLLHKHQEKLIFLPEQLPAHFRFHFEGEFELEELDVEVKKQISLNALLFKVPEPKGVVLYFHGNAGSLRTWGEVGRHFTRLGWDVFMFDYRGYGKSDGKITKEQQVHKDAQKIYEEVKKRYPNRPMVFYGRSLGTGIAAKLAGEVQPEALVLETPYFNFRDVVDHHYFFLPTSLILNYQFRTNRFLGRVTQPVYLIHGTEDELIPYHSSERLVELGEHIQLKTIDGGTHSDLPSYPEYHEWLAQVLSGVK